MHSAFEKQLNRVIDLGIARHPALNPFWRQYVEKLAALEVPTPAAVRKVLPCRVEALGDRRNRDLGDFRVALAMAKAGVSDGPHQQHVAAIAFLQGRKVLEPYLDDMDRLGFVSSQLTARIWWYVRKLKSHLPQPATFLEIGSGGGHFAVMAADAGLVRDYVCVDLPEMLLTASITLAERFDALHVGEAPAFAGRGGVWLLGPDETGLIPDRSIGCAVNFNSFSEMDEQVRDDYVGQVYRTAAPGCLFYNVNRRHLAMTRSDGTPFENHPMRYPYRTDDEIVEWEPDEFQQATRSGLFTTPHSSFCMSRISRIRGAQARASSTP